MSIELYAGGRSYGSSSSEAKLVSAETALAVPTLNAGVTPVVQMLSGVLITSVRTEV